MNKINTTILLFTLLLVAMVSNADVMNHAVVTNNENGDDYLTSQDNDTIEEVIRTRPILPVNWENLREFVKNNTDSVKALVNRMLSVEDPKLTDDEEMLAFFGQSYLSDAGEETIMRELRDSLKQGNYLVVNNVLDRTLKINPLNIEARYWKLVILLTDKDKSETPTLYSEAEFEHQKDILFRMLDAIYLSGNGSPEAPFYVTRVNDEYTFMNMFLHIQREDLGMQAVTTINKRPYDYFVVKNKNKYFNHDKIYFEITRVYETEKKMFGL